MYTLKLKKAQPQILRSSTPAILLFLFTDLSRGSPIVDVMWHRILDYV